MIKQVVTSKKNIGFLEKNINGACPAQIVKSTNKEFQWVLIPTNSGPRPRMKHHFRNRN